MKINFNEMTEQTIPNFLGGNGNYNVKMYVDGEGNKMMVGLLKNVIEKFHFNDSVKLAIKEIEEKF